MVFSHRLCSPICILIILWWLSIRCNLMSNKLMLKSIQKTFQLRPNKMISTRCKSVRIMREKFRYQLFKLFFIVKKIKKIKNPCRNILTNIANQLFGFILSYKKSYSVMEKIHPNRTYEWEQKFYNYVKQLKRDFGCYYNLSKIRRLWFGEDSNNRHAEFHRILRLISKYFIQQRYVICFLTSQKLSKQLRQPLLKARRILMDILRQQCDLLQMPTFIKTD